MLYLPQTTYPISEEALVAPGATFVAEGQAAVRTVGQTHLGVLPSSGTADEIFVGFVIAGSSAAPFVEPFANRVETYTVGTSGAVVLERAPIAMSQVSVMNLSANPVAPVDTTSLTLDGKELGGLTAGSTVQVTYKYALTVIESVALQGNAEPGGYAGAQVGQIGLIKRGTVYTSEFDASVDWSAATAIKCAANGLITDQSGTGVEIKGFVKQLPTFERPFLAIEFDAL